MIRGGLIVRCAKAHKETSVREKLIKGTLFITAPESAVERPECGSYGCRGIGHVKGPKFAGHNSASGCPYSLQNLHKARLLSDRLNITKNEPSDSFDDDSFEKQKSERSDRLKMDKTEMKIEKTEKNERFALIEERLIKTEKDIKQEDGESSDKNERSENSERSVGQFKFYRFLRGDYIFLVFSKF